MQILNRFSLPLIAALLVTAESAFGTQPPDPVTSDGGGNTAMGLGALVHLSDGLANTASGDGALQFNTTGSNNTASGAHSLAGSFPGSSVGDNNTAFGYDALLIAGGGFNNTALGSTALQANTTGVANTAAGFQALNVNTTGNINTASGIDALAFNTTGSDNTAIGGGALGSNTTGGNNIAEGYQAGYNLTTGSNNIDIGNVGVAGESNLIRIGTKGTHKGAVIAGISTSTITGAAVYVTGTGRLGVLASSERYKTAIAPIGDSTDKLQQLRPVSFHLKADPKGTVQYGLIAEEVAKVYPELVIRGEKGRIDGVRYDELAPMLLNEVQKQQKTAAAQDEHIAAQATEVRDLRQQVAELKALNQATQVALQNLQTKMN